MFEPSNATTPNKPIWHAPWKLSRVIRGHEGWIWCIAVDQRNEWFATGSYDRGIKIWDLYSGELKLSLTDGPGCINGLAVGNHHSYLYCSCDEQIKCWDLEHNKVIRHYDGNLGRVFGLDFHDKLDLLVAGCRDGTIRLWDVRTKVQTHCLRGHKKGILQICCRGSEPEIISMSCDNTIRLWDIVAGKERITLTNEHFYTTPFVLHSNLNMMAAASFKDLNQWSIPDGVFIQNIRGPDAIEALAINTDDVFVSGHVNGELCFFDWSSGHNFQRIPSSIRPGQTYSYTRISAMTFDRTDSRLITCGMDMSINVYVEDPNATEESHPLNWDGLND